jgi:hypothetical protein
MLLAFAAGWLSARPHSRVVENLATSVGPSKDVELFAATVHRLRSGESYYDVMGSELRRRNYPTASVFNWRTPLLYVALSAVPLALAGGALVVLAVLVVALSVAVLLRRSPLVLIPGVLLQLGAVTTAFFMEGSLVTEVWAGVLIGLSVCTYALRFWHAGALIGLLALFVREISAPYAVACGVLAIRSRRMREVAIWSAGGTVYLLYFLWHASQVATHADPDQLAAGNPWIYGGGLSFLSSALSMNALLLVSPAWVSGAVLALIVGGILRRTTPIHARSAAVVYLLAFLVLGQPFNYYWGFVISPTLALVAAYGSEEMVSGLGLLDGKLRAAGSAG